MKIHGLVVSVNYADLLIHSIGLWMQGLDSLTVVTDLEDAETVRLAAVYDCRRYSTAAFYRNGAAFNKGLAQQEAWQFVPKDDWILLIDADVIPPTDWKQQLELSDLLPGALYGCFRYDEHGRKIKDDTHGYGYFQLFHASDPLAQRDPFFDIDWTHAGNGDSNIMLRWKNAGRLAPPLPMRLTHPGGKSENWFGRGKHAEFQRMQAERARRGGGWKSLEGERIKTEAKRAESAASAEPVAVRSGVSS